MDLGQFVEEVTKRFPADWRLGHLSRDDCLAAWWVFSQLAGEDKTATLKSLTRPKDGGVDAVHIDHEAKTAYLVQSKLRASRQKREKAADVLYLTRWRSVITGAEEDFIAEVKAGKLSAATRHLLREARDRVVDQKYSLQLQFISTGTAPRSRSAIKDPTLTSSTVGESLSSTRTTWPV